MAKILSGKEVSQDLTQKLILEVEQLKSKGISPTLAFLRVGENGSDLAYQRGAVKKAEKIGIKTIEFAFDEKVSQEELLETLDQINRDDNIHGVLMFRPLPKHLDEDFIRNQLNPSKDIDGITDSSLAGVFAGAGDGFSPCTAQAALEILKYYGVNMKGERAVVIGRSLVVGKPAMMMLMQENATVSCCHSRTPEEDKIKLCKEASILVVATGRINTVTRNHVNDNQIIVDVGINFDEEGNMVGDVDFNGVSEYVKAITPVPGGVGAVTTTLLMKHVVQAAKNM